MSYALFTPFIDENGKLRYCSGGHADPCGPTGELGEQGMSPSEFNDRIDKIPANPQLSRLLSMLSADDRQRLRATVSQLRQIDRELCAITRSLIQREVIAETLKGYKDAPDTFPTEGLVSLLAGAIPGIASEAQRDSAYTLILNRIAACGIPGAYTFEPATESLRDAVKRIETLLYISLPPANVDLGNQFRQEDRL